MRFVGVLFMFICVALVPSANSETINWYVDGDVYTTTTCESGDDIILPNPPTKPGQVFLGWSAYQEIEYIELQSGEMINTQIIPNTNTKFRVKLNMQEAIGNDIIGIGIDSPKYRLFNYNQRIYFDYVDHGSGRIIGLENSFRNNVTYDFLVGAKYVKDYQTDTILAGQEQTVNYTFASPICIGETGSLVRGKIYLLQIWDGDTLVRDMIPVIDENDEVCMYDKVTKQFFYNQGDGNLIAGPLK